MFATVPNFLTALRLASAPLLAIVYLLLPRPYADFVALVLFVLASLTDWVDGYLARAWGQVTRVGAMLDPIADKAMVVIALAVLAAKSSLGDLLLLPAALILFREVFVSGLREFLGQVAGTLKVTQLAKWKTTVQMVAISVLFAHGIFEHQLIASSYGMDAGMVAATLAGEMADPQGLGWKFWLMELAAWGGLALLWLAAILTLVTGWDYFRKSLPHLKGSEG